MLRGKGEAKEEILKIQKKSQDEVAEARKREEERI